MIFIHNRDTNKTKVYKNTKGTWKLIKIYNGKVTPENEKEHIPVKERVYNETH